MEATAAFAKALDEKDPLKSFRDRFHIPKDKKGEELIYLCGNSLGLQPKSVKAMMDQELDDWAHLGVEGHHHAKTPWLPYHESVTKDLATVVGAKNIEVVAMNSLTVNLHLFLISFYQPTSKRFKIVIEEGAFPSDSYAVESHVKLHDQKADETILWVKPRPGEFLIREDDMLELIQREGESIALLLLPGVQYYTGQVFPMKKLTDAAHGKGCRIGFDLAHAVGNVPLQLHDWNVDFAVWCSYKYLNSGPGAIGGAFVHERFANDSSLKRLQGWWGHDKQSRFQMKSEFVPIPGVEGWQLSNPPIFSLLPLRASLEIFRDAGMESLRLKSKSLTGYLEFLLSKKAGVQVLTPKDPEARGCQLSLNIAGGREVFKKLTEQGVVCDWREPDVIRVSPVPLYNTYSDVFRFAELLS